LREDSIRASHSPALEEARELLGNVDHGGEAQDEEPVQLDHEGTENAEEMLHHSEPAEFLEPAHRSAPSSSFNDPAAPHVELTASDGESGSRFADTTPTSSVTPLPSPVEKPELVLPPTTSPPVLGLPKSDVAISNDAPPAKSWINEEPAENGVPHTELELSSPCSVTPMPASSPQKRPSKRLSNAISPGSSPQIGTSLLRRESLRGRESPSKKSDPRKTRSPKKRDTLSRRDTLQEREILQKVIAEASQGPDIETVDNRSDEAIASPRSKPELVPHVSNKVEKTASSEPTTDPGQHSATAAPDAEIMAADVDDKIVGKDLQRAIEAIEILEEPVPCQVGRDLPDDPVDQTEEIKATDQANKIIAAVDVEEATRTGEAAKNLTESPLRKTRSGARFSDDTSMLRDFLNRAQASKAAKTPVLLPLDAPKPQVSPRRSPRKTHGPQKGAASTPQRLGEVANRPGTATGIAKSDILEPDDTEEISATPTSCRRSTRTRPPATTKAPPGAPSFIPVRRADGTDPVVLQKSQAQELAMVTRANTRRNKGQSKPPLSALKEFPAETSDMAIAKQRAENAKAVGWAEELASYQDVKDRMDKTEETKSKVRRMRGLGAANGTPASKKTAAVVNGSNGTPAPKRRGKAMSGK